MQVLLLALSIVLLTILAGKGGIAENGGNVTRIIKTEKSSETKRLPLNETEHDFSIRSAVIDMYGI